MLPGKFFYIFPETLFCMKPMLCLLLFQCGITACLLAQPLLPRSALFQEQDIYRVALSPDGERLYYQRRSANDGRIFYRLLRRPASEVALSFEGAVLDWVAVPQGVLAVVKQVGRIPKLVLAKDYEQFIAFPFLPFEFLRIQAASRSQPHLVSVEAFTLNQDQQGRYLIDTWQLQWSYLGPSLPYQQLFFDGGLKPVAARDANSAGGLSIYRNDGQQWVEAKRYAFDESQFSGGFQQVLSVSADGGYLYCTDNEKRDKTALVRIDTRTGEERLVLADGKADLLPFNAIISPQGQPQMVQSRFGEIRRFFLDAAVARDFEYANRLLQGQARFVQSAAQGRRWLLRREDGGPGVYYLFDRDSRQLIRLLSLEPASLSGVDWVAPETHYVLSRDGYELPVQVYLPNGSDVNGDGWPERPLPTVLFVHGGPWEGLSHWEGWANLRHFQLLANRGYAVINVSFRGTTGRGKYFVDLGNGAWGKEMLYDQIDIAQWAVWRGLAQRDKLAVWGWSYGGYAAAAALTFAPEVFQCGIAMYGPMNLASYALTPFAQNEVWQKRVGNSNTSEGRELLRAQSPAAHLSAVQDALMLTMGGRDGRIPLSQMQEYADALDKQGHPLVYLFFPEEVHDYQQAESWIAFWAVAERFLHQSLGGRYEPMGNALEQANARLIYGADILD
jgi:dipeptidyl aminopeptidase/acylaminoacyl peptidase